MPPAAAATKTSAQKNPGRSTLMVGVSMVHSPPMIARTLALLALCTLAPSAIAPDAAGAADGLHLVLTPSQKPTDLLATGDEFAMVLLIQRGLVKDRDPKTFFREVLFAGAHDAGMRALLNGHVDALASFDMAREQYLTDPAERERIIYIAETPEIPEAGIAARSGLDPATFAKVRGALLQIRAPAYAARLRRLYEIDGFAPADDRDYDPVRAAVELLGVKPR